MDMTVKQWANQPRFKTGEAPLYLREIMDPKIMTYCGACSGIPTCCIDYYMHVWRPFCAANPDTFHDIMKNRSNWGYIPCEKCLAGGHKIQPVKCDDKHCTIPPSLRVYGFMPKVAAA